MTVLLLVLGLTSGAGLAGDAPSHRIHFLWGFGAHTSVNGKETLIPINRDTVLHTGDRFKMFIDLKEKCYIYVLYKDPNGNLNLLFPDSLSQYNSSNLFSTPYTIPRGHSWFRFDDQTGLETFHLLASKKRLTTLESLLSEYQRTANPGKTALGQKIDKEIRLLKKKRLNLKSKPVKPVQIAGRTRGVNKGEDLDMQGLSSTAVEISAENFFAKTYTIDHRN
jgi:hypothetical protein